MNDLFHAGMLRSDEADHVSRACAARVGGFERLPEAAVRAGVGRAEADGR